MKFTADQYYRAALERMEQARAIFQGGNGYALAVYCAGLAVESLLRAFRWHDDAGFEGRHDLTELLKVSKLLKIDDAFMRAKRWSEEKIQESALALKNAMNEVIVLWHNNLRYASEASFRAFLNQTGRLHGVKGNALKKNASDMINAAQKVIERGIALWPSRKKS